MTDFQILIEALVVFGLLFLTFWRRDIILYLLMFPCMVGYGLHWWDTFNSSMGMIICLVFIGIGLFSLALGIHNMLRAKEQ